MRIALAGLGVLLVTFLALADTSVTQGTWDLYRGTSIVGRYGTEADCIRAADDRNELRTFTCRTRTTVVVTADAQPQTCGALPATETRTQTCPTGTTGTWSQTRSYTAAPYPTCSVAGEWLPGSPLPGVCTATPPPPTGGDRLVGDEYFSSDMSSASDGPNYGFDSWYGEAGRADNITLTHFASGGPANRPYVRYVIDSENNGEFGHGWAWTVPRQQISWGSTIFYRFSLYLTQQSQEQKFLMFASSGGSQRLILTIEDWGPGFALRLQKDGGDQFVQWPTGGAASSAYNQWINVQVEHRFDSAPGAGNGYYAMWVNNDNRSAPNVSRANTTLPADNGSSNSYLTFSGYHQGDQSGIRTFRVADFRIGPTFDPSWSGSGQ